MTDILFTCPRCGKSLAAANTAAGRVVTCPDCQREITIPKISAAKSALRNGKYTTTEIMGATIAVLSIVAIIATAAAILRGQSNQRLRRDLAMLRLDIDSQLAAAKEMKQKAERSIADAKTEADQIRSEAKAYETELKGHLLREEGRLQELYPLLTPYTNGRNNVNRECLDSFEVSNGRIKTFMSNRTGVPQKPDFTILFLTKYGFVTGVFSKTWLFDRIQPGQTRIDDDVLSFSVGDPVYYSLIFKN